MNTPIHSPGRATTAIYRDARADDVPVMAEVFLMTVTEMFARNNVRTTPPPRQFVIDNYEHVLATGIFRVAELDGRVAGIAGAVVRDNLWFLSAFWVLPGYQNRNIGMPLLRQVWQAGVSSGAAIGFTWSSVDITAMAAYMKLGMRPGYPILMFEGEPDAFPSVPEPYRSEELQRSEAVAIDRRIRGTGREVDHRFWGGRTGSVARQIECAGRVAGYFYVNGGSVGPVAWTAPEHAMAVLTLAVRQGVDLASPIRLSVPGINHAALQFVIENGLRLTGQAHLLTTAPFGRMEQYLPSGPSFY